VIAQWVLCLKKMDLLHTQQLIISLINVCRFINHSPGYLHTNVLFYVIILLFRSPDAGREPLTPAVSIITASPCSLLQLIALMMEVVTTSETSVNSYHDYTAQQLRIQPSSSVKYTQIDKTINVMFYPPKRFVWYCL
jgi:hypothetical protein